MRAPARSPKPACRVGSSAPHARASRTLVCPNCFRCRFSRTVIVAGKLLFFKRVKTCFAAAVRVVCGFFLPVCRLRVEALWSNEFDIFDVNLCERVDRMAQWRSDTHFAQPHASV